MFPALVTACKSFLNRVKNQLKKITKPSTGTIAAGALSDLPRSKSDLIAENAILRQQLIVLNRQVKRPQLTTGDRIRLVLMARLTRFWQTTLHLIQPDTLLSWHRNLFRLYWKRKSKPKKRKPRIPQETIDLIKQMAQENPFWGAEKIRGERLKSELLKLGISVGKPTIQKYMKQVRRRSGQNWRKFLKNHAHDVWACDFTVIHDLLFRPIYIFIIIAPQTREIKHAAVTRHPTDAWVAQQLREATTWGNGPKYLIRDNDNKFGKQFSAMAEATNIDELTTPFQAPKANAFCERLIGTLKRECLDYHLILYPNQLRRIVNEFVAYYNQSRPHQGIEQHIPTQFNKHHPSLSKNGYYFRDYRSPQPSDNLNLCSICRYQGPGI